MSPTGYFLLAPLWEGAVGEADWGRENLYRLSLDATASPWHISPSGASRHLPRRGRQGNAGGQAVSFGFFSATMTPTVISTAPMTLITVICSFSTR